MGFFFFKIVLPMLTEDEVLVLPEAVVRDSVPLPVKDNVMQYCTACFICEEGILVESLGVKWFKLEVSQKKCT